MTIASALALAVCEAYVCGLGDLKQMTVTSTLALAVRGASLCVHGDLKQMTVATREYAYALAVAIRILPTFFF